jgi:hypothetical protein
MSRGAIEKMISYFSKESAMLIVPMLTNDEKMHLKRALGYPQPTFSYLEVKIVEPAIRRVMKDYIFVSSNEVKLLQELSEARHIEANGYFFLSDAGRYVRKWLSGDGIRVWEGME